ncbi:CD109 antigen-like isoform X3 [Babylonia areolata]|uniref:CD109 antigen-like isoform X3 n=1 Tax=Babylonia areolata TaxID=304850 RepID=UPI003FCEEE2E
MGMGTVFVSLLLVLAAAHTAYSEYVVLVPTTFRQGWDYKVPVTVTNLKDPSVPVLIQGEIRNSRDQVLGSGEVTVSDGKTGMLTIPVARGAIVGEDGSATLNLEGSGGLVFTNSTSITMDILTYATFVQTDKSIYKPGDLVRFRVLTVDKDLKPQKIQKVIRIKNPTDSDLRKYNDDGSKAVFEDTFQLAEFPDMGMWKIEVKSPESNIDMQYPFEVDEYVLPKFEVTSSVHPAYLLKGTDQTTVTVSVAALYTYGKGVTGKLKMKVGGKEFMSMMTDPSGKTEQEIDLADEVNAARLGNGNIDIEVEVTDNTKRMYSTKTAVAVKFQPVKIEFDEASSDKVFRPQTGAQLVIKVTDPVGSALGSEFVGKTLTAHLRGDREGSNGRTKTFTVQPGKTDYVWALEPITSTYDSLNFSASIKVGEKTFTAHHTLRKYLTLGNATMNAHWVSLSTVMWSKATFAVKQSSDGAFDAFWYMVVSRGSVVRTGQVSGTTELEITPELCPKADIVVYGLTAAKPEIVADRLELKLKGCQSKQVRPSVRNAEQRTGTDAEIRVNVSWSNPREQTAVGRHDVYMVAVDKSLLLLQDKNPDLTPAKVDSELEKFKLSDDSDSQGGPMPFGRGKRSIWPGPFPGAGLTSTGELLKNMGLVIVSDAVWERGPFHPFLLGLGGHGPVEMVMMPRARSVPQWDGAAEMAEDAAGPGDANKQPVKTTTVRKDFPDTWIWSSSMTDDNGQLSMTRKLPDSITSWVISAFAVQDNEEIAVTDDPYELAAFNPFFLDLNLPYSIRRYERFLMRTTVFNYMSSRMETIVTLKQGEGYEIIGDNSKKIMVAPGTGQSVEFEINGNTVATVSLVVRATGRSVDAQVPEEYTDEVTRKLIVKPEGKERMGFETFPVVLSADQPTFETELEFSYEGWTRSQIVLGSKRAYVKLTGDLMGNVLNNIDDLVRQPTGCGEQNMITTIPNIFAMKYLSAIDDVSAKFNRTAKDYMIKGYQRETQQYRWKDGGYSAFGTSDQAPSTWLTAFVVKSFAQAREFIPQTVDEDLLAEDVGFLMSMQEDSGYFREEGRVFHDKMQGGTGAGDARTVFITLCLQEAFRKGISVNEEKLSLAYSKVSRVASELKAKAANVTEDSKEGYKKDQFLAAITAYTLTLRDQVDTATVTALIRFIEDTGAPWVETSEPKDKMMYPHHRTGPSAIEITSYTALTYQALNDILGARNLIMFLQKQQNELGGYVSTQDTVMALQAVSEFAAQFHDTTTSSEVTVTALGTEVAEKTIFLNSNNKRQLQIERLPDETMKVKVKVTGAENSLSLIKIVWYYYTKSEENGQKPLTITSETKLKDTKLHEVKTCITVQESLSYSNMMVVHLDPPTGLTMDNILEARKRNPKVKRIELNQNSLIDMYVEQPENMCITFDMAQDIEVSNQQPGTASVYAYYKPDDISAEAQVMLEMMCTGDECDKPTDHASPLASTSSLLLTACLCLLLSLVLAL